MESSIVDYRDLTGVESDSDTEIIDNSVVDESFSASKKTLTKNQTVFVAESEESTSEGDDGERSDHRISNPARRTIGQQSVTVLSSDDADDSSKKGSIRRQSEGSSANVVITSSDEEGEMSPEMVPKRWPPAKARLSESFIGRKTKKRMMILDSDTDNSFIVEQRRRGKQACLKDTPAKVEGKVKPKVQDMSFQDENSAEDDDGTEGSVSDNDTSDTEDSGNEEEIDREHSKLDNTIDRVTSTESLDKVTDSNRNSTTEVECSARSSIDEEPDEDQMVMSRATRMSIMGYIPKENDSDDSDYIQSDDTKHTSRASSNHSTTDVPETNLSDTPQVTQTPDKNGDTSRLTCSPFTSPLRDITNEINSSLRKSLKLDEEHKADNNISLIKETGLRLKPLSELQSSNYSEEVIDDDLTIVDKPPEIIALSSDDEDDVIAVEKKSPGIKKTKVKEEDKGPQPSTIKPYLVPTSYPNQVVYVKKHVRENEMSKLNGLREELQNIRYLLEHMEMDTLPDGGAKLIERLTALEDDVRRQGDKVANMLVEPDNPSAEDIAKDGFGKQAKEPTWEDIQKASNAVQPRMFGKQAMATHMAERNLIMERLSDLHQSLGSRPPESDVAEAPKALKSELMPHQLHALAWLRWRETQRPPGGILADDMGLGKTITMISLIADDKERGIDNDDGDDDNSRGRGIRGGTLVVCPASLMQQWAGEVGKHCAPHSLSVALHHGASRAQHPHRLAANDLVLTTYNILQRESEKGGVLTKVSWRRVILDEAHVVRNHKSATSNAVSALKAKRRWALTGTPLHNKDLDLFALLKFLRCTPFDDLTMWKKWIDNKSIGGEQRLNMIMRCLMLRRTKALLQAAGQLACLPERTPHDCPVTLSAEEMKVYQKVLVSSKTLFAQFLHQRAEKQAGADEMTRAEKDNAYALHKKMVALRGVKPVKSHEILVLLLRLRQMCCHCGLIAAMLSDGDNELEEDAASHDLLSELNKLSLDDSRKSRRSRGGDDEDGGGEEREAEGATATEAIRSALSLKNPVFKLEKPSAKIAAVMHCLKTNVFPNEGEKAVVVSQWTSVLRLVERELNVAGVRCVTLSGNVPVTARPALVDALNDAKSNVRIMLLSLCAGGVGLNLCGASHLLLLDPHWNPQLEQQAQDRVYRVGQTKHVHIYRFMCVDTVEQSIRKLQEAKLELADNILTGARNTNASKLTIDDLKMLFNMGPTDA